MGAFIFFAVLISLLLYMLPVLAYRRQSYTKISDATLSAVGAPPATFQSASVAYSIQLALLGPFFIWGAIGDTFAASLNTFFFMLGLLAYLLLWRPLRNFLLERVANDSSITPHSLIARQFDDSDAVRITATCITLVALLGIFAAEMMGIVAVIKPLLPGSVNATLTVLICMFVITVIYTVIAGNDGAMASGRLQLQVIYISLSLFVVLIAVPNYHRILNQVVASHWILGVVITVLLICQTISFVNSRASKIESTVAKRWYVIFDRFVRIFSILVMLASLAGVIFLCFQNSSFSYNGPTTFFDWFRNKSVSTLGLVSLAILPLCFQVADIANWQKLAAVVKDTQHDERQIRRALAGYAFEAPTACFLLLVIGSCVAVSGNTDLKFETFSEFISSLSKSNELSYQYALAALMVAIFAIALSTMDSVLSAAICAFLYDINERKKSQKPSNQDSAGKRIEKGIKFSIYFFLAGLILINVAAPYIAFATEEFVQYLLAFYGAQLSFVPLVIGALLYPTRKLPAWVGLGSLFLGAFLGIAFVCYGIATKQDDWSWAGVPASLASSSLFYLVSILVLRKSNNNQ